MFSRQFATFYAVNGQQQCTSECVKLYERRKLVMLSRIVAFPAACYEVCRLIVAAIFARFDMVELRALDR